MHTQFRWIKNKTEIKMRKKKCKMPDVNICMNGQNAIISTKTDRQRKNTVGQRDRQTAKEREI